MKIAYLTTSILTCLIVSLTLAQTYQNINEKDFQQHERNQRRKSRPKLRKQYLQGDDASDFHSKVLKYKDCPSEKKRLNLMYTNIHSFNYAVNPIPNEQNPYWALDGALNNGSRIFFTMTNDLTTFSVALKDSTKVMYIRECCAWTFTVKQVEIKFKLSKRKSKTMRWTPLENGDSWFSYGCAVSDDWLPVQRFKITLKKAAPTFNIQKLYCEVCV